MMKEKLNLATVRNILIYQLMYIAFELEKTKGSNDFFLS